MQVKNNSLNISLRSTYNDRHEQWEDPVLYSVSQQTRSLLQVDDGSNFTNLLPIRESERPECEFDASVPSLVSVQTWRSKKQRPRESITLMTQLSEDR